MSRRLSYCLTAIIIITMVLFVIDSTIYVRAFLNGITAWATNVLPTLFPFMILGRLIPVGRPNEKTAINILNTPSGTANTVLVSVLCGYPMGAKLIANGYQTGNFSATNCKKILLVANCASPIFVIATVGSIILKNTLAGIIIYISHILAMFVSALLQRSQYIDNLPTAGTVTTDRPNIMIDSLLAVLSVGGYIALFFVLSAMLQQILPNWFAVEGQLLTSFVIGILEMTSGCMAIAQCTDIFTATVLCCTIISFGGICVASQCMTFLSPCGITIGTLLKQKVVHCALSTIFCFALASFIL